MPTQTIIINCTLTGCHQFDTGDENKGGVAGSLEISFEFDPPMPRSHAEFVSLGADEKTMALLARHIMNVASAAVGDTDVDPMTIEVEGHAAGGRA